MLILNTATYKVGKSVSACTFPKPLLLMNWDDKFESVKNARNKDGTLVVPDWKEITNIPFVKKEVYKLDFQFNKAKGESKIPDYTKGAVELMERYNNMMNQLGKDGCIEVDGKKIGPFKSFVIDSATSMFSIWEEMIFRNNRISSLGIQEYNQLKSILFKQFIPALKTINDIIPYVIINTHELTEKDDTSGMVIAAPLGPSFNQGRLMCKEFDEIWRVKIDPKTGQRYWKTSKDGNFMAGSDHHLPDIIPATYKRLKEILDEREVKK